MKILISGGHLTPALAVIDYVQTHKQQTGLVFAGRLYSQSGKTQRSREREEIKKRNIPFYAINAVKFVNIDLWLLPLSLPRFLWSLIQAWFILNKTKPNIVLSFGGYVAVPLGIVAKLKGIPLVTHEQTVTLGLGNRLLARLAKKVAISFPQTSRQVPGKKSVLTGNPIRTEILTPQPKPSFFKLNPKPLVYITGGRLGSEIINTTLAQILPQLLKKYVVIHQCGAATKKRDYAHELERLASQLPKAQRARYYVRDWIEANDLAWIYRHSKCVVSRAGANTTQELKLTSTPSVLIPLPFAYDDEQLKNAKELAKDQACILIEQKNLGPKKLLSAIEKIIMNNEQYRKHLQSLETSSIMGAENLFNLVESVVSPR
jgi:UDP-N-acetylglucosamine--N-acetylmuramyl-(pentapeptide) pyrophosphoryl-undecaprenol N-acetylglucosamine transferase